MPISERRLFFLTYRLTLRIEIQLSNFEGSPDMKSNKIDISKTTASLNLHWLTFSKNSLKQTRQQHPFADSTSLKATFLKSRPPALLVVCLSPSGALLCSRLKAVWRAVLCYWLYRLEGGSFICHLQCRLPSGRARTVLQYTS